MNLERTESPGWLSNAYLIDDGAGTGVLIDGNGVAAPLLDVVARRPADPGGASADSLLPPAVVVMSMSPKTLASSDRTQLRSDRISRQA